MGPFEERELILSHTINRGRTVEKEAQLGHYRYIWRTSPPARGGNGDQSAVGCHGGGPQGEHRLAGWALGAAGLLRRRGHPGGREAGVRDVLLRKPDPHACLSGIEAHGKGGA